MYFSYLKEHFSVQQEQKNEFKASSTQRLRSFLAMFRSTVIYHENGAFIYETENAAGLFAF